MFVCPMCGENNDRGLDACWNCGEPLRPAPAVREPGLGMVRRGVTIVFWGVILMIPAQIIQFVAGFALAWSGNPNAMFPAVLVAVLMACLASILQFAGKLCCLGVPRRVGARGIITVSVGIDLVVVAVGIAEFAGAKWHVSEVLMSVANLFGTVLFVAFLTRLSEHIGRPDLAGMATRAVFRGAIAIGLAMLAIIVTCAVGGLLALFTIGAALYYLLLAVIAYVMVLAGLKAAL